MPAKTPPKLVKPWPPSIRAAHADGMRVVDLMRMTEYSREGIRKILGVAQPSDEP